MGLKYFTLYAARVKGALSIYTLVFLLNQNGREVNNHLKTYVHYGTILVIDVYRHIDK